MKKLTLSIIAIIAFMISLAQVDKAPELGPGNQGQNSNRDLWDTQFVFSISDNIAQTGAESDGTYIVTSNWFGTTFTRYDLGGNFVDTVSIAGLTSIRDLAYDGQYFYGSNASSNMYVFDLDNQVIIDTILIQGGHSIRSIAYNEDLDVFYTNNWSDEIKIFNRQGVILDTIQCDEFAIYGLAYDKWSIGGPYLWAYTQDSPGGNNIIQYHLPTKTKTNFNMDVSYLNINGPQIAGGLFTQPNIVPGKVTLGGCMQNETVWGLELSDVDINFCYGPTYVHAELQNLDEGLITWQEPRYSILEESFNGVTFPPDNWHDTTNGFGWHQADGNIYTDWVVPDWDSKYALALDHPLNPDGSNDILVTSPLFLNYFVDFELSFESYFDGTNNHSAYVVYTSDTGQTWNTLYTLTPSNQWEYINIDLSNLLPVTASYPVMIGFLSDDNGGQGSGWAIDNVMVYTDDIYSAPQGYNVYRNNVQVNTSLITQLSFLDLDPGVGLHDYYVRAVYDSCDDMSSIVHLHIPPPPVCDPPENLDGYQSSNAAATIEWDVPSSQDPHLAGYHVYRDDSLITSALVTNTEYVDGPLDLGTYYYKVTAIYLDTLGNLICESDPAGPIAVDIEPPMTMILGGNVFVGTNKLEAGNVYAHEYTDGTLLGIHETEVDEEFGYYFFNLMKDVHYYVKTIPSTQSAYYNNYAPTYHGNALYWKDASKVYLEEDMYNVDINLTELVSHETGAGMIGGNIMEQGSFRDLEPASDIAVFLLNENGDCIAFTYSDEDGNYEFNELSHGTYGLFADFVGKLMEKLKIELTEDHSQVTDVNLTITENQILSGNPELPWLVSYAGDIFPNPAWDIACLEIGMKMPQDASISIIDLKGQKLLEDHYSLKGGVNQIKVDLQNLNQGIYILQINFGAPGFIHRKLTITN